MVHWTAAATLSFTDHDLARLGQNLLFPLCAILVLAASKEQRFRLGKVLLLTTVILLAIGSLAMAPSGAAAVKEAQLLLGLSCASFCVAIIDSRGRESYLTLAVTWLSGLYALLILFLVILVSLGGYAIDRLELFPGFDNIRFFNHAQTAVLPILAVTAVSRLLGARIAGVARTSLLLNMALLWFTLGRSTMLSIVAATIACSLCLGRKYAGFLREIIGCAIGGFLIFLLIFVCLPYAVGVPTVTTDMEEFGRRGSIHARFGLWRLAVADIVESPWLGIGPMHYAHRPNPEAAHPHNIYLQVAAEWGVPMLLLLLTISYRGLSKMRRAIKACTSTEQTNVGVGLFAACIAVAVDGFFSGNFVMPVSQMWIALVIGWSIAWTREHSPPEPGERMITIGKWPMRAFGALLVASQLWLCITTFQEAADLPRILENASQLVPNERQNPRFWSHGWF